MKEIIQTFPKSNTYQPYNLEMCGISFCDGSYVIPRPHSKIFCFEYIIQGTGTVKINQQTFHPSAGDIYILHEGDDHFYYSDAKDPWIKIWFNIYGELPKSIVMQYGLENIYHIKNYNLYSLFSEFLDISKSPYKSISEIVHETCLVFIKIVQKISDHLRNEQQRFSSEALLLREYIHKNLDSDISIQRLADAIHLSYSQTVRIFKDAFATTPYNYIIEKRIESARSLLSNTRMPIKDISSKLHFSNEYYFSNLFKQKVGVSPTAYRKQILQPNSLK